MQLIFPTDPLKSNKVDDHFQLQAAWFAPIYGSPALYSIEEGRASRVTSGETLVYRGWMLKPEEYTNLATVVEAKGGSLRTSLQEYLNTHHIPNWYPFLREFTAETKVFDNDTLAKVDINHVFHLLKYSGVPVHDFHDFDQPDYGSVDYRVRTAIATEPVYPEDVEGIIDYLPLWTPEENFVKRAK